MKRQGIATGVMGLMLAAGTLLVGCGTQPGGTTTTSNSVTQATSNTANTTNSASQNNTTGTTSQSGTKSQTKSQPPGPNGASMQKVIQSVFKDPQVTSLMQKDTKAQWGAAFLNNDKNGNAVSKDGKWNLQLLKGNKPVANVVVADGTFKVLSVSTIASK